MDIFSYNNKLKPRARELRNNSTLAEVLLWNELKGKRLLGYEFRRQRPIDNYIIDFYCKILSLAIEIDGSSHNSKIEMDKLRQDKLEIFGITFLRFTNQEVIDKRDFVIKIIEETILRLESNLPPPPGCAEAPPPKGDIASI